jgi:uncharacterized protein (DUF2164 family)
MAGIDLEREQKERAVSELRDYFDRERGEEVGELAATLLFDFIAERLGPMFYNCGVADAQFAMRRAADSIDSDLEATQLPDPPLARRKGE